MNLLHGYVGLREYGYADPDGNLLRIGSPMHSKSGTRRWSDERPAIERWRRSRIASRNRLRPLEPSLPACSTATTPRHFTLGRRLPIGALSE